MATLKALLKDIGTALAFCACLYLLSLIVGGLQ
jgi:hypothetical protein